jgi:hypothetical protein
LIRVLIKKLEESPNPDAQVIVAVYQDNDSGEQDHVEIHDIVIYDDGHVQIKI